MKRTNRNDIFPTLSKYFSNIFGKDLFDRKLQQFLDTIEILVAVSIHENEWNST